MKLSVFVMMPTISVQLHILYIRQPVLCDLPYPPLLLIAYISVCVEPPHMQRLQKLTGGWVLFLLNDVKETFPAFLDMADVDMSKCKKSQG